jgi:hypothetical protein
MKRGNLEYVALWIAVRRKMAEHTMSHKTGKTESKIGKKKESGVET